MKKPNMGMTPNTSIGGMNNPISSGPGLNSMNPGGMRPNMPNMNGPNMPNMNGPNVPKMNGMDVAPGGINPYG